MQKLWCGSSSGISSVWGKRQQLLRPEPESCCARRAVATSALYCCKRSFLAQLPRRCGAAVPLSCLPSRAAARGSNRERWLAAVATQRCRRSDTRESSFYQLSITGQHHMGRQRLAQKRGRRAPCHPTRGGAGQHAPLINAPYSYSTHAVAAQPSHCCCCCPCAPSSPPSGHQGAQAQQGAAGEAPAHRHRLGVSSSISPHHLKCCV